MRWNEKSKEVEAIEVTDDPAVKWRWAVENTDKRGQETRGKLRDKRGVS